MSKYHAKNIRPWRDGYLYDLIPPEGPNDTTSVFVGGNPTLEEAKTAARKTAERLTQLYCTPKKNRTLSDGRSKAQRAVFQPGHKQYAQA